MSIVLSISGPVATLTLNRPRVYNSLTRQDYTDLANHLRSIDARPEVLVTILQGNGKWFCSGTNVKESDSGAASASNIRDAMVGGVVHTATDCSHALYSHSKILVAALNGPVMGIAAAFLGHFDFIYCLPSCWLSVPFAFLGIVAEAGCSVSFVNRMGLSKANEVLLWGKTLQPKELLACGFVNEVLPDQSVESFHTVVKELVLDQLAGLEPVALLSIKRLIKEGLKEKNNPDATNLRESYEQAARFASGKPMERFLGIAQGQLKHKL